MRLILKLMPNGKFIEDNSINHKIQGFIYKQLEDSFFSDLHDKEGSKYFCFSNLFKKNEGNEVWYLIISSPIREIIDIIAKKVKTQSIINIGDYSFSLVKYKKTKIEIKDRMKIKNSTPIILRIPKEKINAESKFEYYYWRKKFGLRVFIDQLYNNMIKKYEKFYGIKIDNNQRIFETYKLIKEVSPMMQINGKNTKLIGSYWEFETTWLDNQMKDLVRFTLDVGLGEMNSLGFGFINEDQF